MIRIRTRTFIGAAITAMGLLAARVDAQSGVSPSVLREVGRARALVEAGAGADARQVLDSLVRGQAPGSNDLAEVLYWRATLAERSIEAERDWKRLTVEAPGAPRAADAMVRLGEMELLRGRPASARTYFDRVVKDFAGTPQSAKSTLWTVRSYFDERNATQACTVLGTLAATAVPDGELRLQYEELGRSCRSVAVQEAPKPASKEVPRSEPPRQEAPRPEPPRAEAPREASARFSVQLAAYDTRAEADALVARLGERGISARVDGDAKPFRVRVGQFATRAEANTALAQLKKQGHAGFIAELKP